MLMMEAVKVTLAVVEVEAKSMAMLGGYKGLSLHFGKGCRGS